MTLLIGTIALLLGPVLYSVGQKYVLAKKILNLLIILTIAWLIGAHIIPEAIRHGGRLAIVVIFLGIAFPMILERLFRKATDTAHLVVVAIAGVGLLVHAVIDGIAMLPESGEGLAYAVILHRIPVGMALWWAVRPSYGLAVTAIVFALVATMTAAGYFVGETILEMAETKNIALLQAFVAGSLLHVMAFGGKHEHKH